MLSRLSVVRGPPRSREGAVLRVGMTVFVMRHFGRGNRWWRGRIEAVEYNFDTPLVGVAHDFGGLAFEPVRNCVGSGRAGGVRRRRKR